MKIKKYQRLITGKILDIGCGSRPYQKIFKNVQSYIGTNSKSYYENSLFQLSDKDIIVEDGRNLPFNNCEFDNALNFQVLPVFEQPEEFLREVKRVLKPGGLFILTVDFLYPIWNPPYNFFRPTKFGLKYLAEKTNWTVLKIEAFGGYWVMQARLVERYFRTLLPKLISKYLNEKIFIKKFLKMIRIIVWCLLILVSPILLNTLFLIFHILDKIFEDQDFTTNYLIILKKDE